MQASIRLFLRSTLSVGLIALIFTAQGAFAKKDLFGSDPAGKYAPPPQQLVEKPTLVTDDQEKLDAIKAAGETTDPADLDHTAKDKKHADASLIQKLTQTLKAPLDTVKKTLSGKDKDSFKDDSHKREASRNAVVSQASPVESTSATPDAAVEAEITPPTISATEAAQRAQRYSEGQVMNVRAYQEENKTLYGVKLLQKNGRMKTVNVDANSGEIVEQ